MYTRPGDLSDSTLATHLVDGWQIDADAVEYVPVGFGSHHWSADEGERRWFVTVDDLDAKQRSLDDTREAIFHRLKAALSAARLTADEGVGAYLPFRQCRDTAGPHRGLRTARQW